MLGQDASVHAISAAPTPHVRPVNPRPQQRVVEDVAKASVRRQDSRPTPRTPVTDLKRLSESARQFAEVLDSTGNVYVASSVSGFRSGALDVYA